MYSLEPPFKDISNPERKENISLLGLERRSFSLYRRSVEELKSRPPLCLRFGLSSDVHVHADMPSCYLCASGVL
jgi:hypothetical protein